LHASVVYVVLHLHLLAARAEHAHEGVAERGIAEMADMGGLVGIDVGVFDDHLLLRGGGLGELSTQQVRGIGAAGQADVDVPVAGHFQGTDAGNGPDLRRQLGSDLFGRLAQLLRQLEGRRHGHLTEIALPRLFDVHGQIDAVASLYVRVEGACNLLLYGMEHGNYQYNLPALDLAFARFVALSSLIYS